MDESSVYEGCTLIKRLLNDAELILQRRNFIGKDQQTVRDLFCSLGDFTR